ncbi:MAG: helix-turn-helix domain-containing protein [Gammaproteobacteria bacterium]|nr:helix-turn-helix domain-containing protein [Gammaproteobacteria bacterium]
MNKKKQWTHKEKFVIALAAVRGEQTMPELCQQYQVSATQVYAWKKELLEHGAEIFNKQAGKPPKEAVDKSEHLYKKIGQLTVERDFLQRALGKCPGSDDGGW